MDEHAFSSVPRGGMLGNRPTAVGSMLLLIYAKTWAQTALLSCEQNFHA